MGYINFFFINNINSNMKKKPVKTYTFAVPCSMLYYIDAQSEKEARATLQINGGVDLKGELLIDAGDYLDAYLHE
tara:strand:- start:440 stop:664 length:225 start_codon:yes stop_codon:yes gene_type:complete